MTIASLLLTNDHPTQPTPLLPPFASFARNFHDPQAGSAEPMASRTAAMSASRRSSP